MNCEVVRLGEGLGTGRKKGKELGLRFDIRGRIKEGRRERKEI